MNFRKPPLLFGAAILHALNLVAQTTQGPTLIPQLNTDYYVGAVRGFYPSIQNAVTLLCAISSGPSANGSRVIIPAGSSVDGTPGFTISAVTGGCTKVAIEDRRATPAGAYAWNGSEYIPQGSGGGCTTGCVLTNPSTDQTITQPGQTTLNINSTWTTVSPANGAGTTQSLPVQITQTVDGASKNYGNPGGFAGDGDSLWRVFHPFFITANWYAAGIGEAAHIDINSHRTGDLSALRIGESGVGLWSGGFVDASGEGVTPIIVDGTQQTDFFIGTVTATTGSFDTAPVIAFSSGNASMIGDGWLIDASKPVATGNLAGTSTVWETNPYRFQSLPTTSVNTPSDGICITTTYIAAGPVLQVPVTQTGSCTVHDGLALPVGAGPFRIMIGSFAPEPAVLTNVSAPSGGIQTFTILSVRPHEIGSYFFHGGTQGLNVFSDDFTKAGVVTDIIVLGSVDTTHQITEIRGNNSPLPWVGSMAETTSSAFTVYSGALIGTLMRNGVTETTGENMVPWTVGDTVWSAPTLSYLEAGISFISTQTSPDNPQSAGNGFVVRSIGGGFTSLHPAFEFDNFAPITRYSAFGGWKSPPPLMAAGSNGNGPVVGDWIRSTEPVSGDPACPDNPTFLCAIGEADSSTPSGVKNLFENTAMAGSQFSIDYTKRRWIAPFAIYSSTQLGVGNGIAGINQDSVLVLPVVVSPGFGNAFGLTVNYNGTTSPLPLAVGKWHYNIDAFSGPGVYCWYETTDVTDTVAYKACSDGSGNEFHQFIGPVSMTNASVLATTTANDLAYFDNATGHLADSGILKANLALLNAANAFTVAQNLPTGSQVNSSLICTVNGTNCPAAPAGIPTFGTPSSSTAACTVPQVEYDASFLYTCVATNSWTRVATTTF
jgi:hypothetical protein